MRKCKKVIAVLLGVIMVMAMTACGGKEESSDGKGENKDKAADITLTFPIISAVPQDLDKVEEELSKIAMEKYNCTITLQPLGFADYVSQAPLILAGSEDIGLMIHFDPITNYSSMVSSGQINDITELLKEHAPEVMDTIGEDYLSACRVDDKLYGVPTMHDLATGYGVVMRTDLLEKYNIDVSNVKTLDDLDAVFEVIKANEPEISPMFTGGAAMNPADAIMKSTVDTLGDGYGVLMDNGQDEKVTNYFMTDEYRTYVDKVYEWNQNGYLLPDSDSIQDTYSTLFRADKIFAAFMTTKPGQVEQDERNTGLDLTLVELSEPLSMTTLVNGIQWVVPIGASNPEKSVEILNLLYTDEEFLNLLNYGIEGEHYVLGENNQIALPDGVTAETSTFNWSIAYQTGNEFLCYTWESDDPELWNETQQYNDEAAKSSAMGFSFDNSKVANEITAITNVCSQYRVGLENGALDPAKHMEQFLADLKTAGIDTVITEKQTQLDNWREE